MGGFPGVRGMAVILGRAWLFSTNRRSIKLKTIAWGLGLQLVLGFFVLRSDTGRWLFEQAGKYATKLLSFSYVGSAFVFGELVKTNSSLGLIFAFPVLPPIIFIPPFFPTPSHPALTPITTHSP